jgi:hypothetical protein
VKAQPCSFRHDRPLSSAIFSPAARRRAASAARQG